MYRNSAFVLFHVRKRCKLLRTREQILQVFQSKRRIDIDYCEFRV